MPVFPSPSNAVVYAQFNLQGRWSRILSYSGLYGLAMGVMIWLTTLGREHYHPQDLQAWVRGFTILQLLNFIVYGSFRVESAVRGDVTSRMIESHRLMPAPPLGSILGYIFGAPLQSIILGLVNFILGAVCCYLSGIPLDLWMLFNGIAFLFAVFIYAIIAQFSLVARGGFLLLLVLGGIAIGMGNSRDPSTEVLPSATVLLYPMLSQASIMDVMFDSSRMRLTSEIEFAYLCAMVGQLAIAAIAIRTAVRRYIAAGTVGLSPLLGLLLLITWIGLAIAYFASTDTFSFRRFYFTSDYDSHQHSDMVMRVVATFVTSALLAMFPIASAARSAWQWRRTVDPTTKKPRSEISQIATLVAAVAIVSILLIDIPLRLDRKTHVSVLTVIIIANFLTGIACLFSIGYFLKLKAWIFAVIWVVLTWLVPIIGDQVYRSMTDNFTGIPTEITALSPAGALAIMWSETQVSVRPGIIGQMLLMLVPTGLLLLMHFRRRSATAKPNLLSVA
jgi:hypothetical protein